MNKTIVPIKGMHCRSCEILIAEKLKENPDIKNVSVNYKKSEAWIYSHHPLKMNEIKDAVSEAGYEVGTDNAKSWISTNYNDYFDLLVSVLVIMIVYLLGKQFGIWNIDLGAKNSEGLLFVLLIGLTAGVSSCMALVGGLILGISARFAEKHPEATSGEKFRPHLFFQLGRIISYILFGGLIGLIGHAFQLSSTLLGLLSIIVGIVMITLGLQLTELFPKISNSGIALPAGIAKFLGIKNRQTREYSHANSVLLGALTFFLPCGFTQAMQLYALNSGNFWSGAAIMGVFAIGTAPGLLGIGGLTSFLRGNLAKKFFKFAGVVVVVFAVVNISNGLNLIGWKSTFVGRSDSPAVSTPSVAVPDKNGVQVINMTQLAGGYEPNQFTIKQGIPVKWVINSTSDTCASSISMPKMGIRQNLKHGENVIEFTPKNIGTLNFSCLMGMYTGSFNVVAK
ncbi:MAG: sulfite exporter TauE/SafE family protein [Candidatus Berkelbacteria bacterium]